MTIPVSNVDSNSQTFGAWLSITNKMARLFSQNTVTVDYTSGGSLTTGNAYVNGYFGANYLTVKTGLIGGNLTSGGNVSIVSNADFSSYVTANGPVSMANTLTVSGAVQVSSTFKSVGAANLASTVNVGGALNVTGTTLISNAASITGNLVISGTANVTGNASFSNNANVSGSLYVTNTASLSNSLSVSGNVVFSGTANVTGAATLSNTLSVAGNTVLSGTANVSGNLTITSSANVGAALNVTGNTTVSGSANVSGNLNVSGVAAVTGNVSANSFLGNGNFITTLNASAVSTGTLPDARLSSAVVNTSGNFTVAGNINFTGTNNYFSAVYVGANSLVNTTTHYVGNASVNTNITAGQVSLSGATVNSTIYTGTANNANYLGTVQAASYVQNTDSRVLSGNINFTAANVYYNTGLFVSTISASSNGVAINTTSISVGNSTVNTTINATAFSGTANNANNLGGAAASVYVNTSGAFTIGGILTHTANLHTGSASVNTQISNAVIVINNGNTLTINASSVGFGNASVNATANLTGFYVNGAEKYINATNITTGTLPDARLSSAVVNTSGSFTIAGILTHTANLHTGSASVNTQISNAVIVINNSNTLTINASSINLGNASVNATVGLTSFLINGVEKYINATNITTGTLPYAQLGVNVVNTTGAFTISGIYTHTANLHTGSSTVNTQVSNAVITINNGNTLTINASSVGFGNASVNAVANLSGFFINGVEKYINATNITTGTLPDARLSSAVVNTSAAFTISGVHTHNANIVANAASIVVQNASSISVVNTTGIYVGNTTTNVVIANTTSSFSGNLVVFGTANVTGAVTFSNTMSTTGSATFSNNVTVTNVTNTANLNVTSFANISSLNINSPSATSVVNGNFTVVGTLSAGTLATSLQTNGSIIPTITKTFDLGSGANSWLGVYTANVFATNLVSTSNLSTTSLYTSSANVSGATNTNSLSAVTANVSTTLGVQGVITAASNVAITGSANVTGNVVASGVVQLSGAAHLGGGTYTFNNSLVQADIDQISATSYRSVEYFMQLTDSTTVPPKYHTEKISIVHDGTSTIMTEYAIMFTSTSLGTFDSVINAGNVILKLTPSTANVVAKFYRTAVVV